MIGALLIAAKSAASTVIGNTFSTNLSSSSNNNDIAFDNANTFSSVKGFASAFSITKSSPASVNDPTPGIGNVVVTSSSSIGLTTKLTVLVAVNPSAVVTVNVIGNCPPVSVTARNASN